MVPKRNLVFQIFCIIAYIILILFSLNTVTHSKLLWAVGAGSLSSSAYIVFANPSAAVAKSHKIIGSYIIALAIGLICHIALTKIYTVTPLIFSNHPHIFWFSSSIAVGISVLLMILLKYEHPPAAGVALVSVVDINDYSVIMVILLNAVILTVIKLSLRKKLLDLAQ